MIEKRIKKLSKKEKIFKNSVHSVQRFDISTQTEAIRAEATRAEATQTEASRSEATQAEAIRAKATRAGTTQVGANRAPATLFFLHHLGKIPRDATDTN